MVPVATAATDAFKLDAMTPEPDDLDTVAPNSPVPSPPQPLILAPGPRIASSSSRPGSGSGEPLEDELRSRLSQLVIRANSKDSSSSEEECATKWPADKQKDRESVRQREKSRPSDIERERQWASDKLKAKASQAVEQVNGQEMKRSERLIKSASVREEGRVRERRLERGGGSLEEKVEEQGQKRGDKREPNRQSKRQHKRDGDKEAGQKAGAKRSGSSASSPAVSPTSQEGVLSNNQVR